MEFLTCLAARDFPIKQLKLLRLEALGRQDLALQGLQDIVVEELTARSFDGVDIALFSAGGDISGSSRRSPVAAGCVVVDNSSAFRMQPDVPLVVPEINPGAIARSCGIIANPNCSTIIAMTPLWPIHKVNPLRRVTAATYRAASGAGAAAMAELGWSTRAYLDGQDYAPKVLPHPYAFNLFSHNSAIDPQTGYNDEEAKMVRESRKIFGVPDLRVSATCVRVPVLRAHAVAITVECERPIRWQTVRHILADAPGVQLVDDRDAQSVPDAARCLAPG